MKKLAILFLVLGMVACKSKPPRETTIDNPELKPAPMVKTITEVRFETTAGDFVVAVYPDWAPIGAQRFLALVKEGFFDGAAFFRVVPGFVVQFGLAADPSMTARWEDTEIRDDPVTRPNRRGTITFATSGPNTRTTQVFINFSNNGMLDQQGFAPFGAVVSGMENVDRISSGHGQAPDQTKIKRRGNAYLQGSFPRLDYIRNAAIIRRPPEPKEPVPDEKEK